MDEYISRDEIIEELEEEIEAGDEALDENVWVNRGLRIALKDIKKQPAAAVQPVRHGHWIGVDYDTFFECSECKNMTDWQRYKYCPYCGARMDGEQND